MFRGVSLGRLFGGEMTMALVNYHRLSRSLKTLIVKFCPKEIWFYDFKYEINHLNIDLRRKLVESIAKKSGLKLFDIKNKLLPETDNKNISVQRGKEHGHIRLALGTIYFLAIEISTFLYSIFSFAKPKVLLLVGQDLAEVFALGYHFKNTAHTPIFFGRTIRRKFKLIFHCMKNRMLLVNSWKIRISKLEARQIQSIYSSIEHLISTPESDLSQFTSDYIRANILNKKTLSDKAIEVKSSEVLINRYNPSRIVVDSARSSRHLQYIELAKSKNIPVDYTWHSPLLPQNFKIGALGGDPRQPTFVDRILTWGKTNEEWARRIGAKQPFVQIGSPKGEKIISDSVQWRSSKKSTKKNMNILLLQYTYVVTDLAGTTANMYGMFVNGVRVLKSAGYRNIQFKIHPGPGRWTIENFKKIEQYYDLRCNIMKTAPFERCLEWADIVIGPTCTGTLYETIAAGKPYIPIILQPQDTIDLRYFRNFPVITSIDEIPEAIEVDIEIPAKELLKSTYGADNAVEPSKRFWAAMN